VKNETIRLRPSSSKTWLNCPGSVKLSAIADGINPPSENNYQAEGTAAHALLELSLRLGVSPSKLKEFAGDFATAEDFIAAVEIAYNFINDYKPWDKISLEKQLTHRFEGNPVYELSGRADVIITFKKRHIIIDYKHGAGVPVIAEGNTQLLTYAALLNASEPKQEVEVVIIQPRCWSGNDISSKVVYTWDDLSLHLSKIVAAAVSAASADTQSNKPEINKRKAHAGCGNCSAVGICPTLHSHLVTGLSVNNISELSKDYLSTATLQELMHIYKNKALIIDFVKSTEAFLTSTLSTQLATGIKSELTNNYNLQDRLGVTKWTDLEQVADICEREGLELNKRVPKTPKMLLSEVKSEELKSELQGFTGREKIGMKMKIKKKGVSK